MLLFLIEHAPLERWERDVLEIIRDEAYYFAPQAMTKIMNEGWATYWHSKIMTQKALRRVRDHRLRRPRVGRDRVVAGAAQSVQARRRALSPHRGALGQGAVRQRVGRVRPTWRRAKSWDRRLGLGKKKIFEVRKLYNDITFIDEFFTEEFCREQQVLLVRLQRALGQLGDRDPRVQEGERQAALPADQLRAAVHLRRGRQLREPRRAAAASTSTKAWT